MPKGGEKPMTSLVCPECGAAFLRPTWRVEQAKRMGQKNMLCSKQCAIAVRTYRTSEIRAQYHAEYRQKNRDWINEKQSAAWHKDIEKSRAKNRERYRQNRESNRARAREYAANHKDKAKARSKAWPIQNPERARFHIVRNNLAEQTGLMPREVPAELVELKTMQLEIARFANDAKAMETGTTKTEGLGAKHDSAVP